MCGISGYFGEGCTPARLRSMVAAQQHRGPDDTGLLLAADGYAGLGHNRLSILDLSASGHQPMSDAAGRLWIVFNGEIYNYLDLRAELHDYPFRSRTDTEVILAAYQRWGQDCLHHLVGMFSFLIWDSVSCSVFGARDRFGVKPFYYHHASNGDLAVASEIKAIHAAGIAAEFDEITWSTYLTYGLHDHGEATFWKRVRSLPGGQKLHWQHGKLRIEPWYDLAERVGPEEDSRSSEEVEEECLALLTESVRLRFQSDVPVGVNLSGGLDSSVLLALVNRVRGDNSSVKAYTYITNTEYDELPWVQQLLAHTPHESIVSELRPEQVASLFDSVQKHEDEPFGGLPTIAYGTVFERARADGTIVLLDGQGMDEQWAGYNYYAALEKTTDVIIQGTSQQPIRPDCLVPEFKASAEPAKFRAPFPDPLRNALYRDTKYTKIPRVLRFNDRISMRSSTELREPFLDHRLVELACRQSGCRKIKDGVHKWLVRRIAKRLVPGGLVEAPKRPLQTPQREWLRNELCGWATDWIEFALWSHPGWLNRRMVRRQWESYLQGECDNSYFVWQWLSLGAISAMKRQGTAAGHVDADLRGALDAAATVRHTDRTEGPPLA